MSNYPRKRIPRQGSATKREAKRRANFGTKRRHNWWHTRECVCTGLHPACSGGRSDPSHTRSKAVHGDERTIIPQSRGCHDYIGTQGWAKWEGEVGALVGMPGPLDRHALAAALSLIGPDAPGVSS